MNKTVKRGVCLVCAILLAISLVSCKKSNPDVPDGMKSASNADMGYTLFVPDDWMVTTGSGSLMSEARVSKEDSSNVTMAQYYGQTEEKGVAAVRAYFADYQKTLETMFDADSDGKSTMVLLEKDGFETVMGKENKNNADGGVPAVEYNYTATLGGINLRYTQVIAFRNGYFFIFTFTTTPELYERHASDVADMVAQIVID